MWSYFVLLMIHKMPQRQKQPCRQRKPWEASAFHWAQTMSSPRSTWLLRYDVVCLPAVLPDYCYASLTDESACSGILLHPDSRRWVAAAWVLQVEWQSQLHVSAVACICAVPDFSICSHRSFLPPRPAAAMGRTSSSLRYPQVLCVISQYPWFSFYYKILQVTEQLLKQDNVLNTYSKQQLAQNHPAGLFLTDLCHQCPQAPIPGKIIRSVTMDNRPPACQQHTQTIQPSRQCTPCSCTAVCLQDRYYKYACAGCTTPS